METTVNQRIKIIYAESELSYRKFADKVGISSTYLKMVLDGNSSPSTEVLNKISRAFPSLNPEWLIMGKGDRNLNQQAEKTQEQLFSEMKETIEWQRAIIDRLLGTLPSSLSAKLLGNRLTRMLAKQVYMTLPEAA